MSNCCSKNTQMSCNKQIVHHVIFSPQHMAQMQHFNYLSIVLSKCYVPGRCQVESTILQSINKPLCHCLKYIRPLVMSPILIFHDKVDFSKNYFHLHYLHNMEFNLHLLKALKRILYLNYIKKPMKSYKSQRKYF